MSLHVTAQCLMCHFNRTMKKAIAQGDDKKAMAFARELMQMYASAPEDISSPWYNPQVSALFSRHFGLEEEQYLEEKDLSNRFVMDRFDTIYALSENAEDPVLAGLQLAILGNYMDFAALQDQVSFEKLDQMLREALNMQLDMAVYEALRQDLQKGRKLLYLTDNAGEIGMDRIFAQQIHKAYPHLEITFCVRGGLTVNDATREDAAFVGIPFPVIDNGNLVSGTQLDQLSPEAKEAMDTADVIIAKGMANTETLYGSGYPIYYAFLVKCPRFMDRYQRPKLTPMLVKEL